MHVKNLSGILFLTNRLMIPFRLFYEPKIRMRKVMMEILIESLGYDGNIDLNLLVSGHHLKNE